jgi:hypothetical protein
MPDVAGSTMRPAETTEGEVFGTPITVGNIGTGAQFTPATNPTTPGDTTDCAAAIQAAFNWATGVTAGSPYTAANPAPVRFMPGQMNVWNAGSNPVPILIPTGAPNIQGSGEPGSQLIFKSSCSGTISLSSTQVYTNTFPATNGSMYIFITGSSSASGTGSATTTGTTLQAFVGSSTTSTQVQGIYLLGSGDTFTPTFHDSGISIAYYRPKFQYSAAPNFGGRWTDLLEQGGTWSSVIDLTANPTGAGAATSTATGTNNNCAWQETGGRQIFINVRLTGTVAMVADFMLDGAENSHLAFCQCQIARCCVPGGNFTWIGGTYVGLIIMAQTAALIGLSMTGQVITPANSAQGWTMSSWGGYPVAYTIIDAEFYAGSSTSLFNNLNSSTNTVYNIEGGYLKQTTSSGTTSTFTGNVGTTYVNFYGGTSLISTGNVPLFASAPGGLFFNGQCTLLAGTTAAQLLANTQYASNAVRAIAGFSNPSVIASVSSSVALGTASTTILTAPSSITTGLYRINVAVTHITASESGTVTVAYNDAKTAAACTATASFAAAGAGVSVPALVIIINAATGTAITVAGTIAAASDAWANAFIEAV